MSPTLIIVLLSMLLGIQPVATDLYLPALPTIKAEFGAELSQVQLTLSALLLAFGTSQLVWGPLSDRFGRRPILLCGLGMFTTRRLGLRVGQQHARADRVARLARRSHGRGGDVRPRHRARPVHTRNRCGCDVQSLHRLSHLGVCQRTIGWLADRPVQLARGLGFGDGVWCDYFGSWWLDLQRNRAPQEPTCACMSRYLPKLGGTSCVTPRLWHSPA